MVYSIYFDLEKLSHFSHAESNENNYVRNMNMTTEVMAYLKCFNIFSNFFIHICEQFNIDHQVGKGKEECLSQLSPL